MERLHIVPGRPARALAADEPMPGEGYVWLILVYEEADQLAAEAQRLTGVRVYEDHVDDVKNLAHASSFDSTEEYELVIFRGLKPDQKPERIETRPLALFNFERLLVTIGPADSRSVAQVRTRYVGAPGKCPQNPDELMHRLLSALVDAYLELRHGLSERLDGWQRALLDPRRPFRDWYRLLEQRTELRRLMHLCEEQLDAITEWRDDRLTTMSERLHVRFTDLIEHIERVKDHARQTEQQAESAVQLYFAATSTRTNEVIRLLTLITAIFMPLNLITGIYGMNFDFIPGLHSPAGFWISLGFMLTVVVFLVSFFRWRRWL
ncbi:MAG: magnesium transporter CorA family protein [Bacteroidota bacterium]